MIGTNIIIKDIIKRNISSVASCNIQDFHSFKQLPSIKVKIIW